MLSVGSVNKLLPIPGVTEYAHGFRGLPEALYLHDHVVRQIELAELTEDPAEQRARTTFVVVGAGYTGTEVAAHGQLFTDRLIAQRPHLKVRPRWMLLDVAPRVLPELDQRMSVTADRVLRGRGVDVRMGTSVAEATPDGVMLTDGEYVPTCSLVWCVGVRPDPFVAELGLRTERGRPGGRRVPQRPRLPGGVRLRRRGRGARPEPARADLRDDRAARATPGQAAPAHNIAASYGQGARKPYKHHDLGWVVDLGGKDAAANPLKLPLSGLPAKAVTRGYHLLAMPGNRARVGADWLLDATLSRPSVRLGLVPANAVPLESESPEVVRRT